MDSDMAQSSAPAGLAKAGAAKPRVSSGTAFKRKRGMFGKELRIMMYGFGDDPDPLPETVDLMEDIVVEYVTDMVHKSQAVALRRGKLSIEDILFCVRKDPRKFTRVRELLAMSEELKRARKQFEVGEEPADFD